MWRSLSETDQKFGSFDKIMDLFGSGTKINLPMRYSRTDRP